MIFDIFARIEVGLGKMWGLFLLMQPCRKCGKKQSNILNSGVFRRYTQRFEQLSWNKPTAARIQKAKHSTFYNGHRLAPWASTGTFTVPGKSSSQPEKVGGVMHAGAAPWVRMIRSGLQPRGFFLCFSAVKHLLNISEAAARIMWPRQTVFSSSQELIRRRSTDVSWKVCF